MSGLFYFCITCQLAACSGSSSMEALLKLLHKTTTTTTTTTTTSSTTTTTTTTTTGASITHYRSFSCNGRLNGLYPDLASRCSLYYRCIDGAVFSYSCPSGQTLDIDKGHCTSSSSSSTLVSCPTLPPATPKCFNQSDGFYPDFDHQCTRYFRCVNGSVGGEWQCPEGSLWDASTGSCGSKSPTLVCMAQSCRGMMSEGPHPTPTSACTSYYTCSEEGMRTDHVCPYNTIFDYTVKRCVSSSNPSSVCYEGVCEGKVNGLHTTKHSPCNIYHRCFNGALVNLKTCPKPQQIFDGRRCVSSVNYTCWAGGRGECEDKEDGLYFVSHSSDCRGFYLCRHQQFIRSFLCSPGLVFNGRECVAIQKSRECVYDQTGRECVDIQKSRECVDNQTVRECVDKQNLLCKSTVSPPPRLSDCFAKSDGFYIFAEGDCRNFYYCHGGRTVSEFTCPERQLFNGYRCVDDLLYRCPDS